MATRTRPALWPLPLVRCRLTAYTAPMTITQAHINRLVEAWNRTVDADELLRLAVVDAKDSGSSWADIGYALGVTRQTAWERWGRVSAPT